MPTNTIPGGTVHKLPLDLKNLLTSSVSMREAWLDITPLARNEWICWLTSVKKIETRKDHLRRVKEELLAGKRRPCCWIGCVHRKDKPVSRSVQWALKKRNKAGDKATV